MSIYVPMRSRGWCLFLLVCPFREENELLRGGHSDSAKLLKRGWVSRRVPTPCRPPNKRPRPQRTTPRFISPLPLDVGVALRPRHGRLERLQDLAPALLRPVGLREGSPEELELDLRLPGDSPAKPRATCLRTLPGLCALASCANLARWNFAKRRYTTKTGLGKRTRWVNDPAKFSISPPKVA